MMSSNTEDKISNNSIWMFGRKNGFQCKYFTVVLVTYDVIILINRLLLLYFYEPRIYKIDILEKRARRNN